MRSKYYHAPASVFVVVVVVVVVQHFQTSSPPKPLSQSKPNFMLRLIGMVGGGGGTKVCINGPGQMTKMAAMPIYGKNLQNLLPYS